MRGALAGVCVLLCSCDTVFMLDRAVIPDAPIIPVAPIIIDPDLDYDDDGEPNATDLCPLIKNTVLGANEDSDGDGVGNLCDPAPTTPGDCLALFDMFQGPGELSPHWRSSGARPMKSPGQMNIPESVETIVYLDVDLPLSSLTVVGYIPGGVGARRAIQLLFDHERIGGVTGRACGVERGDRGDEISTLALVEIVNGSDTTLETSPLDDTPIGAGTTLELGWNDRHVESGASHAGRCRAELENQQGETVDTGIAAIPPPGGAFGLRTRTVGFNVHGIVGYGHNCVDP